MKKIVSVLLVVALALTAVNANGQKEATGKSWKVQLITMDDLEETAQAMAEAENEHFQND